MLNQLDLTYNFQTFSLLLSRFLFEFHFLGDFLISLTFFFWSPVLSFISVMNILSKCSFLFFGCCFSVTSCLFSSEDIICVHRYVLLLWGISVLILLSYLFTLVSFEWEAFPQVWWSLRTRLWQADGRSALTDPFSGGLSRVICGASPLKNPQQQHQEPSHWSFRFLGSVLLPGE